MSQVNEFLVTYGGLILFLLGAALLSKIVGPTRSTFRAVANIAAVSAAALGLLILLEYFSKSNTSVDLWMFRNRLVALKTPSPGRVAFPVALAAFWLGLAIAFAARNSAAYFTTWYPQYRKAKYDAATALPGTN